MNFVTVLHFTHLNIFHKIAFFVHQLACGVARLLSKTNLSTHSKTHLQCLFTLVTRNTILTFQIELSRFPPKSKPYIYKVSLFWCCRSFELSFNVSKTFDNSINIIYHRCWLVVPFLHKYMLPYLNTPFVVS